jgi:hypothetical protein
MDGADITLKHMVANAIHQDMLAYAARQRTGASAFPARPEPPGIAGIRAAVATMLLRAGSWLMLKAVPERCASSA